MQPSNQPPNRLPEPPVTAETAPKPEYRSSVYFRTEGAFFAMLNGDKCRVSVAIFADKVRIIAIGEDGVRNFSHKQLLSFACVQDAERFWEEKDHPPSAALVRGGRFIYLHEGQVLSCGPRSETLGADIPEEHLADVTAAILDQLRKGFGK